MWAGKERILLESVDSTNEYAKSMLKKGAVHGTLIVAKQQLNGRGRRGRRWVSAPGDGIFMSLIVQPKLPLDKTALTTLIAALAVTEAVKEVACISPGIKWPNDILIKEKKVCGILTELEVSHNRPSFVIVGIGINVNMKVLPLQLKDIATSLYMQTGVRYENDKIIDSCMRHFETFYEEYQAAGDFHVLKELYQSYSLNLGRPVTVISGAGSYQGMALGIGDDGQLLVEKEDGQRVLVVSGEVSIRSVKSSK